jgi:hypothetical protein
MVDETHRRRCHAAPAALILPLLGTLLAAAPPPAEVAVHTRFEHSAEASREYPDPLGVVEARVTFSRGLESITVPAFWRGGRAWGVRFVPPAPGEWSYRWQSADPELGKLSGKFRAVRRPSANPLERYGAIRLDASRRRFAHLDGTPWFWLSDTAWNGALLSTHDEWEEYCATRARQRFTAVQFVMTQWRAGRADENGRAAFSLDGGTLRIDPAFFDRMDERFFTLIRHGLAPVPVILWALTSRDKESPGASLSNANAVLLGRYIAARYGALPVLWFLGGDGDYRGANTARWQEIGRGVFPAGLLRRPVSLHPGGMQDPWEGLKDEPWLDFLTYQTGHGDSPRKWRWNATEGVAKGWKMTPVRPVLDGEPDYEGHIAYNSRTVIGDATVRRAVYYSLLAAPTAGITYGAHGVWYWSRKPEVPLDHAGTGATLPWRECLKYPGAAQMTIMRDLLDKVGWTRLEPDQTLLAANPDTEDFAAYLVAAAAEDNSTALLYLPANPSASLNLSRFGRPVTAVWLDPRTGAQTAAGRLTPGPAVEVRPPGPGDWLLWLRR